MPGLAVDTDLPHTGASSAATDEDEDELRVEVGDASPWQSSARWGKCAVWQHGPSASRKLPSEGDEGVEGGGDGVRSAVPSGSSFSLLPGEVGGGARRTVMHTCFWPPCSSEVSLSGQGATQGCWSPW